MTDPRRALPSVDRLLREDGIGALLETRPRTVVIDALRSLLDAVRTGARPLPTDWPAATAALLDAQDVPSLRAVINATGVVLHTNLGRAPLAPSAVDAAIAAAGYATLEYDLASGNRGSRQEHVAATLARLTEAPAALVVNNAAGALVLALQALAAGREVVISRGELIEIGGSFRIPDILSRSGAILREVGTTNRTHLADYAAAIGPATGAILTVHRSNFAQVGFVASPEPSALAALAAEHGVPYIDDVGSGLLLDLAPWGLTGEPVVPEAVRAGPDLVIFSGDKLLGGPQAGCLVGSTAAIAACRDNPLARALRADKMSLAALEATLALYRDAELARTSIPVLRMLTEAPEALGRRATSLRELLTPLPWPAAAPSIVPEASTPGGGSFPDATLPTTVVVLDPGPAGADSLSRRLRLASPPLVARVQAGQVLLDPRTISEAEIPGVVEAVRAALEASSG